MLDCRPQMHHLCQRIVNERNSTIISLQDENTKIYIGTFRKNQRDIGIFRRGHATQVGKWIKIRQDRIRMEGLGITYYTSKEVQIDRVYGYFKDGVPTYGRKIGVMLGMEFVGQFTQLRRNFEEGTAAAFAGLGYNTVKSVETGELHEIIYGNVDVMRLDRDAVLKLYNISTQKNIHIVANFVVKNLMGGAFSNRQVTGKGFYYDEKFQYKGDFLNDFFHGYGRQKFYDGSLERQGLFYSGKFIKGIQRFENYTMQGSFMYQTQRTDDTIYVSNDRIMVGRSGQAVEAKYLQKVQGTGLDSGAFEQGDQLVVEWRQLQ